MVETPQMSQMAVQFGAKLREQWLKDIRDAFDLLDPYALKGKLTKKSLPAGILRDTGDYNPDARYSIGDVTRGTDGRDYRATAPTGGTQPGPGVPNWEPIEGWNENHSHDGTSGNGIQLDAENTHEDVVLGPAVGAIHWDEAALVDLIEATGTSSFDPDTTIIPAGDCHVAGTLVDLLDDIFCRLAVLEGLTGGYGLTPFGTGSFGS